MNAYLIDPEAQVVSPLELPQGLGDCAVAIHRLIGGHLEAILDLPPDLIYYDSEGLLKNPRYFWAYAGNIPLPGPSVMIGRHRTRLIAPSRSLAAVRLSTRFYEFTPDNLL